MTFHREAIDRFLVFILTPEGQKVKHFFVFLTFKRLS